MVSGADQDAVLFRQGTGDGIAPGSPELERQVERFLLHEADLMDGHRYQDWLELWDDEALYWVPSNAEDVDPDTMVSIIYDRRAQLEDRIFRMMGKHIHSQSPRSRLMRLVSNISIVEAGEDRVVATSRFVLGEIRGPRADSLFGRSTHTLVRRSGEWKIAVKKVFLLNNDVPMRNVTFLV